MRRSTFDSVFLEVLQDNSVLSEFFMRSLYGNDAGTLLFHSAPGPHMCEILRSLFAESQNTRPYAAQVSNCYIRIFLAEILRTYGQTYSWYGDLNNADIKIPVILSYLKSNFRGVTLSSAAEFFGYDSSCFGKLVKRTTGMNFTDIVNQYRTEQARTLLEHTDLSLDEVCAESGFRERDHFCRIFRKYTGSTPARYRKEKRAGQKNDAMTR